MFLSHLRANLVAYLALVIALGTGTSYAAAQIANGSVTTKKLAKNAVISTKVRSGSLKGSDIKDGSIGFFDIGNGAVSSGEIFNGAVRSEDIQDGTVDSVDVEDETLVRADIKDGVIPADGDVFVKGSGANPPATPEVVNLNQFAFTLDRNGKVHMRFFAGAYGVTCDSGNGSIGLYLNNGTTTTPVNDTATVVPDVAGAGAVELIANSSLVKGSYTLSVGEDCPTGGRTNSTNSRVTWSVNLIAR